MSHFHVVGVCRQHGATELRVFGTLSEARTFIFDEDHLRSVFPVFTLVGTTDNILDFRTTDEDDVTHDMFMSWGEHAEGTVADCEAMLEAQQMIRQMQALMASLDGMNRGGPRPEQQEKETPFDFSSLEDFLKNNQGGDASV